MTLVSMVRILMALRTFIHNFLLSIWSYENSPLFPGFPLMAFPLLKGSTVHTKYPYHSKELINGNGIHIIMIGTPDF